MREVISGLKVWNAAAKREVVLPPGTVVTGCRIRRNVSVSGSADAEAYSMEFEAGGQRLACPLFLFLPRTGPVEQTVSSAVNY